MRLDSHQHFWIFDPARDAWITERMQKIRRDFLPEDIISHLHKNNLDGVIAVQADQSHGETDFLTRLAQENTIIKGVVGWVDLRSAAIETHLQRFSKQTVIKGFRHIVEAEQEEDFLLRPDFQRGIAALTKFKYTYDLLVSPRHYRATLSCVAAHPQQLFMLDHMAKPPLREGNFSAWSAFISELSKAPNVYCKISGLLTEADWQCRQVEDFEYCIAHAISCFGKERICFGSDWPVCLLAGDYEENLHIVEPLLTGFSRQELEGFWGGNAARFYGIDDDNIL